MCVRACKSCFYLRYILILDVLHFHKMADSALLFFFFEGLKKREKNNSATLYALSLDVMLDKQELTDMCDSLWLTLPFFVCVCEV